MFPFVTLQLRLERKKADELALRNKWADLFLTSEHIFFDEWFSI